VTKSIDHLLNLGIYTPFEASQLTGVSVWCIRRWLRGYRFKVKEGTHHSPPVWKSDIDPIENTSALSFHDMLEVRFVSAFLAKGVSWPNIRKAHERAAQLFEESHPFSKNRFQTDGHGIFVELYENTGDSKVLELAHSQQVFAEFVKPFFKDLEFSKDDQLLTWWPLGKDRLIVLDPRRSFGQPIVSKHGVPARALSAAAKKSNVKEVARWYEVSEQEVKDAVEFEQRQAA
jgi:uncharacterized protein (DUF433 family)